MGDPLLPGEGFLPGFRSLSPELLEGNSKGAEEAISLLARQKTGVGEENPTHPWLLSQTIKEQVPEAEAGEEEGAGEGEASPPGEEEGKVEWSRRYEGRWKRRGE